MEKKLDYKNMWEREKNYLKAKIDSLERCEREIFSPRSNIYKEIYAEMEGMESRVQREQVKKELALSLADEIPSYATEIRYRFDYDEPITATSRVEELLGDLVKNFTEGNYEEVFTENFLKFLDDNNPKNVEEARKLFMIFNILSKESAIEYGE